MTARIKLDDFALRTDNLMEVLGSDAFVRYMHDTIIQACYTVVRSYEDVSEN